MPTLPDLERLVASSTDLPGLWDDDVPPPMGIRRMSAKMVEYGYAAAGRPVEVRGNIMRSHLEARVALSFDLQGIPWTYEPVEFVSRTGERYTPDFRVRDGERTAYVEVKPEDIAIRRLGAIQRHMEVIWEHEPDAVLVIVTNRAARWKGERGAWEKGHGRRRVLSP